MTRLNLVLSLSLIVAACGPKTTVPTESVPEIAADAASMEWSMLLQPWTGPYGGVPPLDKVKVSMFAPAVRAAMADHMAEMEAIATSAAAPTLDNTVLAFERSGAALDRVGTAYWLWSGNFASDEFREIKRELAPELAAHSDAIYQDTRLYKRVQAVYDNKDALDPVEQRLTWVTLERFRKAGAHLEPDVRARVASINQELSKLYTSFGDNLLADEEGYVLFLGADDLAGLPESYKASAAAAAAERGKEGAWAVTNTRSSMAPFLTHSDRRDLREKVWTTYYARGDNGDAHDNNALISGILKLRSERAKLLGYETHAHYRLYDKMAGTPERAMALLEGVWPAAVDKFAQEVAKMQSLADEAGDDLTIEAWDVRYYAEKVRQAEHDLDETQLQAYLQLDNLREGMFWAAGQLYGWTFERVTDVPVPHEDFSVYKVLNDDGSLRGLWYFDPFARQGKRSGAWMNAYRSQQRLDGEVLPIVSNNSNFVKPAPGEPVLISWSDARTLFHEFGHAIHGLASDVTHPSLSGTSVARDYVEFPSQLNERWMATPELLAKFALHHETGEVLPVALVERLKAAANFNSGFQTVEYLASALMDMKLHLAGDADIDADAFERDTLAAMGMPSEVVMRHRTPQFAHVFSGEGYSAGYYSYLWSDTLTADAVEAFVEAGGLYDPVVAKKLFDEVLSVGNTVDQAEAYRAFRGRDPDPQAVMRARGFVKP